MVAMIERRVYRNEDLEEKEWTTPFHLDSQGPRSPSPVRGEESRHRATYIKALEDIEDDILRAEKKKTVAETMKRQAKAMLEKAEAMEREAADERECTIQKKAEITERMWAEASANLLGSGNFDSQPLPRSKDDHCPVPPIIINRADDDLETLSSRSRHASSSTQPTSRKRRPSSSDASTTTETTSSSKRGTSKAKLRGGGSHFDGLELHRKPRPKNFYGQSSWKWCY